jgi:transcriptional regulator with XRE-family HTH domain
MTIALKDIKARLLADPEVQAEYERLAPEFEIANTLVRARAKAGLSQKEIAERMGTTQSAVARIESGKTSLRTATIQRYAEAIGCRVELKLVPAKPSPARGDGGDPAKSV